MLAKMLKVVLMWGVDKLAEFIPQISIFGHELDLFDEDAEVEARLLLV